MVGRVEARGRHSQDAQLPEASAGVPDDVGGRVEKGLLAVNGLGGVLRGRSVYRRGVVGCSEGRFAAISCQLLGQPRKLLHIVLGPPRSHSSEVDKADRPGGLVEQHVARMEISVTLGLPSLRVGVPGVEVSKHRTDVLEQLLQFPPVAGVRLVEPGDVLPEVHARHGRAHKEVVGVLAVLRDQANDAVRKCEPLVGQEARVFPQQGLAVLCVRRQRREPPLRADELQAAQVASALRSAQEPDVASHAHCPQRGLWRRASREKQPHDVHQLRGWIKARRRHGKAPQLPQRAIRETARAAATATG
mmetsp:Transcript_29944/g.81156  ORF Transcript_29944/g.81156 Transcript_29944/m.81156 type:complete len:304 (-) Transcript_29944:71-982(-)